MIKEETLMCKDWNFLFGLDKERLFICKDRIFGVTLQKQKEVLLASPIKSRSMAHEVIKKMLGSLGDQYTRFLSPEEVFILHTQCLVI